MSADDVTLLHRGRLGRRDAGSDPRAQLSADDLPLLTDELVLGLVLLRFAKKLNGDRKRYYNMRSERRAI